MTTPQSDSRNGAAMKHISIKAAKDIAERFGFDQVVIVARKVGGGEHVVSYGIDKANCDVAARIAYTLRHRLMSWPLMDDVVRKAERIALNFRFRRAKSLINNPELTKKDDPYEPSHPLSRATEMRAILGLLSSPEPPA
jgi:hypothetical protein